MKNTAIDHLVVAADSLAQGADWCERTLGVRPQPGGQHALMGTHNLLLQLSSPSFPRCYLEIIAIDLQAAHPGRARWFGLDQRTPGEPGLVQVVVRSPNLGLHRQALLEQGVDPGQPVALSRGDLRWQMLLREDAQMPAGLPMLIEWGEHHPADRLPDAGCALVAAQLGGVDTHLAQAVGLEVDPSAARGWMVTLRGPSPHTGLIRLASTQGGNP